MEEINKENPYKIISGLKIYLNYCIDSMVLWFLPGIFITHVFKSENLSPITIGLILILYVITYYTLTEGLWGKSLAKFLTKTHVIKIDGSKPGFKKAFIRAICIFNPLDWFSFFFYKSNVFWRDKVSNTLVVEDEKTEIVQTSEQIKTSPENVYQPLVGKQDKSSSKIIYRVFWIGLILIIAFFCFGMFQVYKMSKSFDDNDKPQVISLVDQYIKSINQGNNEQAYNLLTDDAKSKLTLDQFNQQANSIKQMSNGYINQDSEISSSLSGKANDYTEMNASYTTKVNFSDGTGEIRANLSKINSQWKIDSVSILSHAVGQK